MPEPEDKPSEQGRYAVLPDGTVTAAGHDLPMTYQWPVWLRLLAACVTGAAVAWVLRTASLTVLCCPFL